MAFKFAKALVKSYSEVSQKNPLRWEILYRDGEKFKPVSGKIKCRDFFNDMVVRIMSGRLFQIYRFDNSININKDGIWMRLTGINDPVTFEQNIDTLNAHLAETVGFGTMLIKRPRNSYIIFIPRYFWTKTYYISALTGLIRVANYGVKFENIDEWLSSPLIAQDGAINTNGVKLLKSWKFVVPPSHNQYWWFSGEKYNSAKMSVNDIDCGSLHNNGVNGWAYSAAE